MEQSDLIRFEEGMDEFLINLKEYLAEHEHVSICHCSMPRCLEALKVVDENSELTLRLVLVACAASTTFARLSWLDRRGQDHVCCYLNRNFEVMRHKVNGMWGRDKHTPEVLCMRKWSQLQSNV